MPITMAVVAQHRTRVSTFSVSQTQRLPNTLQGVYLLINQQLGPSENKMDGFSLKMCSDIVQSTGDRRQKATVVSQAE